MRSGNQSIISSYSGRRFLAVLLPVSLVAGILFGQPYFPGIGKPDCNSQTSDADIASLRGVSLDTLRLLQARRGMTNGEMCDIPQAKLERAIRKANQPKPDHPGEAVAFRLMQQKDENGYIPPDGLSKATRHISSMLAAQKDASGSVPSVAGIGPTAWTSLGPGNIGGRSRSVVIHPTNTNTMWLGSVAGGIWKTTDGGTNWQAEDDFMANLAVSTLAMDPGNPDIIYAGTGEGFYNGDGIRGAGVFKTIDGGTNWTQLSTTANADWYYVNRLAISPTSTSTLLAATRTGIWRSIDSGTTWTKVNTATNILDVDFDPSNGNLAVASGFYGRTYYSTNGGLNWTAATGIATGSFSKRVEVAYAPSNPAIVYASVYGASSEIWRSTNGGQVYTPINTTATYLGSQGWYDNIIWVDPTNSNTIVVGGIDLWRSTNGGASLTKISQWWSAPLSAHADNHYIVAHPDFDGVTNTTVFFANDGGIYKTDNVYTVATLSGWQELNNTLGITQFYGAAGNASSGVIVGGTQDNGTLRFAGNTEGWTAMFGGDGGFCAADPTDPNYFYGEYVYLRLHRSSNAGLSSSYIYSGISDASFATANFISPFILDSNNPNTLLGGGASLWRSTNVKAPFPTWSAIKASIGSYISAIAVAPGNSDIIWVGHNNGNVYKTTNGTDPSPIWTQVDTNTPFLPNRYTMRITIDANNNDIVYATFGGFSINNVWRTDDGGLNWADITGSGTTGLPDVPVRSLVIHPSKSNWLYVGTGVGIFASEDTGATWSVSNDGPANVSVDELFWMGTTLVAATHGRGLFSYELTSPDTDGDGITDEADNCILVPNGPLIPDAGGNIQRDTDGDDYGNVCDPDFDNNLVINPSDLFYLKSNYLTADPDADLNGDGIVNPSDLFILKSLYLGPPGPSCCAP